MQGIQFDLSFIKFKQSFVDMFFPTLDETYVIV